MSIVVSIEHGGKGVVNETPSGREIAISTSSSAAARTQSVARSRSDRCIPLCCPKEAVFRSHRCYQECVPVCREVIYKCEEVRDPCSSPAIREIVNSHLERIARHNNRKEASVPPVQEESEPEPVPVQESHSASLLELTRAETPAAPADSTPAEHQLPAIHAALRAADNLPPPPPGRITVVSTPATTSVPVISETPVQPLLREASAQKLSGCEEQQAPQQQIVRPKPVRRSTPRILRCETPYEVLKPIFVKGIWCRPVRGGKIACPDPVCCDPCKAAASSKPITLELIVEGDVTLESNRAFTSASSRVESARLSSATPVLSSSRITTSGGSSQAVVPVVAKTNSIALSSSSAGSRKLAGRSLDLVINGQTIRIEF
jgi:hypothetical protein